MNTIIICAGLFFIGLALQFSSSFWFAEDQEKSRDSSLGDALRLLSLQTQLAAVLLGMVLTMGPFSLVAVVIILFALAEAACRHSIQERRALAWVFAAAANSGVPISEALTAFYASEDTRRSTKGMRLISLLSLGMPLHLSLQGAGIRLTPGIRLATAQGVALGALPERLARAINDEEEMEEKLQKLNQTIGYSAIVLTSFSVATFAAAALMIYCAPVIERMAEDYRLSLPAVTNAVIGVSRYIVDSIFISAGVVLLLMIAPTLAIIVGLHQFGFHLWDYPLVTRMFPAFDRARLYRAMAVSFQRKESLLPMFDQLGVFFPRSYIRNRLKRARNRFVRGEDWLAALHAEWLIPTVDRGILQSAKRHGNIAWALEELAAIRTQRQIQRLESSTTVLNMLLVLALGLFVLLYSSVIYLSIAKLIGGLQ